MKKKVLLIIALFMLCSCSANYELNINDEVVTENLILNEYELPLPIDLIDYVDHDYTKKLDDDILKYSINYKLEDLNKSDFLSCFDSFYFNKADDRYILKTGKYFKCLPYQYSDYDFINYDELEIVLSTNHEVLSHNADYVKFGKYYWKINKDSVDNKEISFVISEKAKPGISYVLPFIATIILIIGLITYLIIRSKSKKNNKI